MTEQSKDGGPAFPIPDVSQNQATGETVVHQSFSGITVRDYFAAKAMGGILADPNVKLDGNRPTFLADLAYTVADAMLAAREKQS
jgi:hypothetical protein